MPHPLNYYPDTYSEQLFTALDLAPGQEAEEACLEPLFAFQRQWAGEVASRDFSYDTETLRSYALYYMTINMPKLWFMLDRCQGVVDGLLDGPCNERLRVTELGCGPGTFLWALAFHLQARRPGWGGELDLQGIDREPGFLELGARLAKSFDLPATWTQADWQAHLDFETDLLILGNTLHEQPEVALAHLPESPAKAIIVIEPGTRESFHRVLPWRDRMLAAGWHAYFPCPTSGTCPMAADNWCHFHINRFALPFIQRMSSKAKRLNPRHHFTGFVFSREPLPAENGWRVMSKLRRANRSAIRYLCDGEHLVEAVVNRRAKSPSNQPFVEAEAGDLIAYYPGGAPHHLVKTGKLLASDRIELLAP